MSSPALTSIPIPLQEPISIAKPDSPLKGFIPRTWIEFFTSITQGQAASPTRTGGVVLTAQSASLPSTDLATGVLSAGGYQVLWYAAVTQAATVSSSLQATFTWTDEGQTKQYVAVAMTGNTITTIQADIQLFIVVDGGSPVTVTLTYASVGGTPMKYKFRASLLSVPA